MNEFCIYLSDLNERAQERLIKFLGGSNGNYDVIPIAILTNDEEDGEEDEEW